MDNLTATDDWEPIEPAKKRQRMDKLSDIRTAEALVRDDTYYKDDADCVVLVDNVLFRVHRFLLGRDESAFQHMFSLPSKDREDLEGSNDENPIHLQGDTADEFRALLSVLYALPFQIQAYNTPQADIDRLLTIAAMTNKYHFVSIESWAVDALYNVLSAIRKPTKFDFSICAPKEFTRVLEVAILCSHDRLREFVVRKWSDRILSRSITPAPAIVVADKYGLRTLQGVAYYIQLMEMNLPRMMDQTRLRFDSMLSSDQRMRLFSGHWSLANYWDRLRTAAPKFERPDGCTFHQHGCLRTWSNQWLAAGKCEETLRYGSADVVGRLRSMESSLKDNEEISALLTPMCRQAALKALSKLIEDVQDGLVEHFIDRIST